MLPTELRSLIKLVNKPRVLILGETHHVDVGRLLQVKSMTEMAGLPQVETYGFGIRPNRYDHWIPASETSKRFMSEVYVQDSSNRDYLFDVVILDLRNWMERSLCTHDQIWQDAVHFLAPGGLAIVVGEALFHRELIGSYAFRLERVHMFPERVNYGVPRFHFMVGIRRPVAYPNPSVKHLLACYLEQYNPKSSMELFKFGHTPAPASLRLPADLPYEVTRANPEEPIMIPRTFSRKYLAAAMVGRPGPFEEIRKHLFGRGDQRTIRIPLRPTVGNLAKLATLADGPVEDDMGKWWAIKGVPETIQVTDTEHGEKVVRDLKRLNLFALQLTGDDRGTLIESQLS